MRMLVSDIISNHISKTKEGYLLCRDAILARTGKQEYRKNELYNDSDDESIVEVDRPYEEVFDEKTLASIEGKPVTIEHPDEDVTVDNYKKYAVGTVRNVRKGRDNGEPVIVADLLITDAEAIDAIESGKLKELSCGYDCDIDDSDGDNMCQRNIRINHLALCEQGRAGNARIIDSKSKVRDMDKYEAELKKYLKIENEVLEEMNRTHTDGNESVRAARRYIKTYGTSHLVDLFIGIRLYSQKYFQGYFDSNTFSAFTKIGYNWRNYNHKELIRIYFNNDKNESDLWETIDSDVVKQTNPRFYKAASQEFIKLNNKDVPFDKMKKEIIQLFSIYDSRKVKDSKKWIVYDADTDEVVKIFNNYADASYFCMKDDRELLTEEVENSENKVGQKIVFDSKMKDEEEIKIGSRWKLFSGRQPYEIVTVEEISPQGTIAVKSDIGKDRWIPKWQLGKMYAKKISDSIHDNVIIDKYDLIFEIKNARIPLDDTFMVGNEYKGWMAKIEHHGIDYVEVGHHNSTKTSSMATGRIWRDGKMVHMNESPLITCKEKMIQFLKGVRDSKMKDAKTLDPVIFYPADFKEQGGYDYWKREWANATHYKGNKLITWASEMLQYMDDFKPGYIKDEIKDTLMDIKVNFHKYQDSKVKDYKPSDLTNIKLLKHETIYDYDEKKNVDIALVEYTPYGDMVEGNNRRLWAVLYNYKGEKIWTKGATIDVSLRLALDSYRRQKELSIKGHERYLKGDSAIHDEMLPGVDDWVINEAKDIVRVGFDDEEDLREKIQDLSDDLTPREVEQIIKYLIKTMHFTLDSIHDSYVEVSTQSLEESLPDYPQDTHWYVSRYNVSFEKRMGGVTRIKGDRKDIERLGREQGLKYLYGFNVKDSIHDALNDGDIVSSDYGTLYIISVEGNKVFAATSKEDYKEGIGRYYDKSDINNIIGKVRDSKIKDNSCNVYKISYIDDDGKIAEETIEARTAAEAKVKFSLSKSSNRFKSIKLIKKAKDSKVRDYESNGPLSEFDPNILVRRIKETRQASFHSIRESKSGKLYMLSMDAHGDTIDHPEPVWVDIILLKPEPQKRLVLKRCNSFDEAVRVMNDFKRQHINDNNIKTIINDCYKQLGDKMTREKLIAYLNNHCIGYDSKTINDAVDKYYGNKFIKFIKFIKNLKKGE